MNSKVGSALLAAALLCSAPSAAWAGEPAVLKVMSPLSSGGQEDQIRAASPVISEEKARQILDAFLPAAMKGENLEATLQENDWSGDELYWQFNCPASPARQFWASIDAATGELKSLSYNPRPSEYKGLQVRLTRDQALAVASEFLKTMLGERYGELALSQEYSIAVINGERPFSPCYSFFWNQKSNGAFVQANNASVSVNALSGKVNQYYCNWQDMNYPPTSGVKPPGEIAEELMGRVGLCLSYDAVSDYDQKNRDALVPSYRLNCRTRYIDAASGQFIDGLGRVIGDEQARLYDEVHTPDLNQAGREDSVGSQNPKEKAERIFRLLGYTGKVQYSGGGSTSSPSGQRYFSTFRLAGENNMIDVSIDSETGAFAGFSDHRQWRMFDLPDSSKPPVLTYYEAKEKAWEMVNKLNPDLVDQLVPGNGEDYLAEEAMMYHIKFSRLLYGIPSSNQGVDIVIMPSSGEIVEYNVNWYSAPVQAPRNLISREEAASRLDPSEYLILTYISLPRKSGRQHNSPLLVYQIKDTAVNALTGELIDSTGFSSQSGNLPEALAGDRSCAALSLLWHNGLIPSSSLQPANEVSQRDGLNIIKSVSNAGNVFYGGADNEAAGLNGDQRLVRWAVKEGLVESENQVDLNRALSRKDFALWAVRALGYAGVAEMKSKVELPASDSQGLEARYWNPVAIALGLNILGFREPGILDPDQPLTWSELGQAVSPLLSMQRESY